MHAPRRRLRRIWIIVAGLVVIGLVGFAAVLAGSTNSIPRPSNGGLRVVVAENFWGSIVKQEAGNKAQVASVIVNPNADPHAYEPSVSDAKLFANAQYAVYNGVGYDPWAAKLLSANPSHGRRVLEIGSLFGEHEGDNPHLWYNPLYVARAANRFTADLKRLDPKDATYFTRQHNTFVNSALKAYHHEISLIASKYHGVAVGSTESIFQYLAEALHLNLITPYGFMKAISEGSEPTAQDKATLDDQITKKLIKVFVYNSQNATPDTNSLESKAREEDIPTVAISETLQPASATFETWQSTQLRALQSALHRAIGK